MPSKDNISQRTKSHHVSPTVNRESTTGFVEKELGVTGSIGSGMVNGSACFASTACPCQSIDCSVLPGIRCYHGANLVFYPAFNNWSLGRGPSEPGLKERAPGRILGPPLEIRCCLSGGGQEGGGGEEVEWRGRREGGGPGRLCFSYLSLPDSVLSRVRGSNSRLR